MKIYDYHTQKNLPFINIDYSVFTKSKGEKRISKNI